LVALEINKTGNKPTTRNLGASVQPLLQQNNSVRYSECVFRASDTQHPMRMRPIGIYGLPVCTIFSTLSHKRQDFRKKKIIGH